jgi:predicted membrane-bound mannosyltransferase
MLSSSFDLAELFKCATGYVLMDIDALLRTPCHPAVARPTTTSMSMTKDWNDCFSMVVMYWEAYSVSMGRCGHFCISGRVLLLSLCARFGCTHPHEIGTYKFDGSDRLVNFSQYCLMLSVLLYEYANVA